MDTLEVTKCLRIFEIFGKVKRLDSFSVGRRIVSNLEVFCQVLFETKNPHDLFVVVRKITFQNIEVLGKQEERGIFSASSR